MRDLTEYEVLEYYREVNAIWFFDYKGDREAPHVELTSGLCSDGYINSMAVLSNPETVGILARQLVFRLYRRNIYPDWVVGSAYAAITFSYEVARCMGALHGFVEKDPVNPKRMVWQRLVIPRGATVLQCEELITTLGTTLEVRRAITEGNPEPVTFLPVVAAAIYRPSQLGPTSPEVIALVPREVKNWEPSECQLCVAGSKPFRPKQHWAELTGKT